MGNFVFNVAKGAVRGYYDRVKNDDPSTSRLVIIPIESSGIESDAALIDSDTVAEVLDGATNEQTTMGRKYLTQADLTASAQDDANDRLDLAAPDVLWTAAAGNAVGAFVVAYDPNTSADSAIIPLTKFDLALTPDGNNFQLNTGNFFRAA
jgi:hypothetical protein